MMIYGVETVLVYTKKRKRLGDLLFPCYIYIYIFFCCILLVLPPIICKTDGNFQSQKKKRVLFVEGLRDLEL